MTEPYADFCAKGIRSGSVQKTVPVEVRQNDSGERPVSIEELSFGGKIPLPVPQQHVQNSTLLHSEVEESVIVEIANRLGGQARTKLGSGGHDLRLLESAIAVTELNRDFLLVSRTEISDVGFSIVIEIRGDHIQHNRTRLRKQVNGLECSEAALPISQQQLDTGRTKRQCSLAEYNV